VNEKLNGGNEMSKREEALAMLNKLPENEVASVVNYINGLSNSADEKPLSAEYGSANENEEYFKGNVDVLFESIFG
jgi:hypothetical protein